MHNLIKIFLLLQLFVFSACSSQLDFDQTNDLVLKPVVTGNLSYFDVDNTKLIRLGIVDRKVIIDSVNFDLFKGTFFEKNMDKAVFFYEIKNTLNTGFTLETQLIDSNKQTLKTININVPAYNGAINIIKQSETFDTIGISTLLKTVQINYKLILQTGQTINPSSTRNLVFKSYADLYFNIK
jgi:hypothetical protein